MPLVVFFIKAGEDEGLNKTNKMLEEIKYKWYILCVQMPLPPSICCTFGHNYVHNELFRPPVIPQRTNSYAVLIQIKAKFRDSVFT